MSFLSTLFKQSAPVNFLQVDMHSHLIPGIDDGVSTLEESIHTILSLQELGYKRAITTPHIMGDFFKNTPKNINEGLEIVKSELKKQNIDFNLQAAAEYYLDEWFVEKLEFNTPLLTFGDNYLLVETSYMNKPNNLNEIIFKIKTRGYKVILAHPERYTYMYHNFNEYIELYNRGVLFQINLNSLAGYYSPAAKTIAEKLIDNDMVDFVGTDCHGSRHIPHLKKSLATKSFAKIKPSRILNNTLS